jgi:arsenic resistance protein ArsH
LLSDVHADDDWVARLELSTALKMVESEIINQGQPRLRILVLYGSMRNRSVPSSSPLLPKPRKTVP